MENPGNRDNEEATPARALLRDELRNLLRQCLQRLPIPGHA
jgi:hypothetical protein